MKDYDNFFLPASDLNLGKEFYQGLLGLEIKFDFASSGMVAFKVGVQEPAIILRNQLDIKPTIWFTVDDVTQEYNRLKAKGIEFISPPFTIRTGLAVEFEDPFGNRLGITDYSANNAGINNKEEQ